jgi:hypothetical protein
MTKKMDAGASAGVEGSVQVSGTGFGRANGDGGGRGLVAAGLLAMGMALAAGQIAQAQQQKLGSAPPVTYDNKYEVYGSLNFMNFQAGQNLPKRMNLGGGEFLGTYWLKGKWGLGAEYRGEAGTTPVFPQVDVFYIHRPLVYMNMGLAGMQYRGPKNQYAAINYHAYGGLSHGVFDAGTAGAGPVNPYTPAQNAQIAGLYSDRTSPIFALGGTLDFNRSKNWAVRLSPDLILEHFGTETREFFAISGGIVYRIPNKKKK